MSSFTPEEINEILNDYFEATTKRQYIGARYVPIFGRKDEESIAWDNSAPYEPLTIVLYQGNSYTSRQYVPADVEITNTDYWALTGNYNAQIEAYRSEVAALEESLDETTNELSDFEDKFAVNDLWDVCTENQKIFPGTEVGSISYANLPMVREDGSFSSGLVPCMQNYGVFGGQSDVCAALTLVNSYLTHAEQLVYGGTYGGNKYEGTLHNPTLIDPKLHKNAQNQMQIECCSFTTLISNGVLWDNSRYTNNDSNYGYHYMFNPTELVNRAYWHAMTKKPNGEYSYHFPVDSVARGRLGAGTLARYLYDKGVLEFVDPSKGRLSVQPGDIIFMGYEADGIGWNNIAHTAICGGVIGAEADQIIVVESVNNASTGLITRQLSRTMSNNGPILAKYTPNYSAGARFASLTSARYNGHYINIERDVNFANGWEWKCGSGKLGTSQTEYKSYYGARVITIVPNHNYVINDIKITLHNVCYGAPDDDSWDIVIGAPTSADPTRNTLYIYGIKTLIIPYGYDVSISSHTMQRANICTQICCTDKQIHIPTMEVPYTPED